MLDISVVTQQWQEIRQFSRFNFQGFETVDIDDSGNLFYRREHGEDLSIGYGYFDSDLQKDPETFLTLNCKSCVRDLNNKDLANEWIQEFLFDKNIECLIFQDYEYSDARFKWLESEGFSYAFIPTLSYPGQNSGMLIVNKVGPIDAAFTYIDELSFALKQTNPQRNANYIQLAVLVGDSLIINNYTSAFASSDQRFLSHKALVIAASTLAMELGKKLIIAGDFNTYGVCTDVRPKPFPNWYELSFLPNVIETIIFDANAGNIKENNRLQNFVKSRQGLQLFRTSNPTFKKKIPRLDKQVGWVLDFVISDTIVYDLRMIAPKTDQDHYPIIFSVDR